MTVSTEQDRIAKAQEMDGPPFSLPWTSFREFFLARVNDLHNVDRTFLSFHDDGSGTHRRYSYGEFGRRVGRVAAVMHDRLGLRRGDRIATVLFNHDQTVLVYFAAWTLGVAVVPINVDELPEKKQYIIEHSEASAVFCWQDYVEEIKGMQPKLPHLHEVITVGEELFASSPGADHRPWDRLKEPLLDDEALIVYTSGTTGPPKGVVLEARHLLVDADGIAAWHGFVSEDRLMCVLPIHHVNGTIVTLVTPFYFGGAVILNRKFKPAAFWKRIHEERVTCVSVVPTLLEFLLDADEDLSGYRLDHFRGMICGAGPLLKETAARFEDRFGFPIRHGYGLSETTCYSCFLPGDLTADEHRRWLTGYEFPSIGLPIRHNEMAILDEQGSPVGESVRGEICIRGRNVCAGYFKRPDANDAAFRDGWFRSGDEGFYVRDSQGRPFFFISGRIKELIIRGGVNISPLEIDDALKGHPGVKFAMAVPFENRYYGEEIAAYIVPRDEANPPAEAELRTFCAGKLPQFKRPKVFLFGQDVPYTTTGKPKRLELKNRLAGALAAHRDTQFK